MKIALFSDVHANLPALEAMFEDMGNREIDALYCLGDLVGYHIWPNEVIDAIRARRIPTIAGNYDFGVGRNSDECGCAYKTEQDREMGKLSISFTNQIIGQPQRDYLRTLPAHINVEFQISQGKSLNLLMVHGSPRKNNEYLFEDREERSLLRMMEEAGAQIMCFGHTHKPYHRVIARDGGLGFLHAINTGSVGKPKDGNPQGCYVLLTLGMEADVMTPESISVEFIRFDYDVERSAIALEASPLPSEYAMMLRRAF